MTVHVEEHKETQLMNSEGVFKIMHQILMREEENDIGREHFWIISLFRNNRIMNIELISLGSMSRTIVEPLEAFGVPFQKKASKVILVHNHPSGDLTPSEEDKDITDMLIQTGRVIRCPVIDHLIISTKDYFSFADAGLLAELEKSTKYGLDISADKYKHWRTRQMNQIAAKMIMKKKYDLVDIKEMTGFTIKELEKMKKELMDKKKK